MRPALAPDAVYLSPHPDDAALSCGARIHAQTTSGLRVLIVTVMAGDPPVDGSSAFAQSLQRRWGTQGPASEARRIEDRECAAELGAQTLHHDLPDCIYRTPPGGGPPLYASEQEIFGELRAEESARLDALSRWLGEAIPESARQAIHVPLCLGGHVDHRMVRAAAERAFPSAQLRYYEDFPRPYPKDRQTSQQLQPWLREGWEEDVLPVSAENLRAKVLAIAKHRSQLSTFFTGLEDLRRQVHDYADAVGGERLWVRARAGRRAQ